MSDVLNDDEFDLESIFMDGSNPIVDDKVFECDKPHWRVSKEELLKVLRIVASFPSKSTVFMAMWRGAEDNLHIHANNRDAFVDVIIKIQNKDNRYDEAKVYVLDSTKLMAFVSAYGQFVFSFDDDGTIHYESPYVRYKLDTLNVNVKEMKIDYEDTGFKWKPFPLSKSEISTLRALYGFAIKLSDSKVLIDKNKCEAFYTLYKYTVQGTTGVDEKVVVRRLDLPTIQEIADDSALHFEATKDRLYYKFSLGVVSFLRVAYDEASFMYPDTFATGDTVTEFTLDVPLTKRALRLTALFGVEEVEFSSIDDSSYMVIPNKAKFKVGSGTIFPFTLSLDIFGKILATVSDSDQSIQVHVTEHGIDLILKKDATIVYSLSRISINQIKQGKVPQTTSSVAQGASIKMADKTPNQTVPAVEFQDEEVL